MQNAGWWLVAGGWGDDEVMIGPHGPCESAAYLEDAGFFFRENASVSIFVKIKKMNASGNRKGGLVGGGAVM